MLLDKKKSYEFFHIFNQNQKFMYQANINERYL